jgi:hypothetical protein
LACSDSPCSLASFAAARNRFARFRNRSMSCIVGPSMARWDHTKTTLDHAQPLRCLSDMIGRFGRFFPHAMFAAIRRSSVLKRRPPNFWWPSYWRKCRVQCRQDAAHNPNHRIAIGVFDLRQLKVDIARPNRRPCLIPLRTGFSDAVAFAARFRQPDDRKVHRR